MPRKTIRVDCDGSDVVDIDELRPFQGSMKTLTDEAAGQLRQSITTHGFSFPFFVYRVSRKSPRRIIDGHQRLKVLQDLRDEGWTVPPLPIVEVRAKSRDEAKRKLLAAASQYGQINVDGVEAFVQGMELGTLSFVKLPGLDLEDLAPATFDALPGEGEKVFDEVETTHECPQCGYKW